MLWYLHLCAINGIVVREYRDRAVGRMVTQADGGGKFEWAELHPVTVISASSDSARALALHEDAHRLCFIARSVNFEVEVAPEVVRAGRMSSNDGALAKKRLSEYVARFSPEIAKLAGAALTTNA